MKGVITGKNGAYLIAVIDHKNGLEYFEGKQVKKPTKPANA